MNEVCGGSAGRLFVARCQVAVTRARSLRASSAFIYMTAFYWSVCSRRLPAQTLRRPAVVVNTLWLLGDKGRGGVGGRGVTTAPWFVASDFPELKTFLQLPHLCLDGRHDAGVLSGEPSRDPGGGTRRPRGNVLTRPSRQAAGQSSSALFSAR